MYNHRSIYYEFLQIHGVSKSSALKMCKEICVAPHRDSRYISAIKKKSAISYIKKHNKIEFELQNEEIQKFVHLYTIKHLKSLKHKFFLPINGQRNCTNGATAKKMASKLRPIIYKQLKQIAKRKKKLNASFKKTI
jgi:ribosomal protein S13